MHLIKYVNFVPDLRVFVINYIYIYIYIYILWVIDRNCDNVMIGKIIHGLKSKPVYKYKRQSP
jgi:hypothetical protein